MKATASKFKWSKNAQLLVPLLSILLISFGGGLAYMGLGWLFNRRKGKDEHQQPG